MPDAVLRHLYTDADKLIAGNVNRIAIVDTLQLVPGECRCIRVFAVIGFHQHRTVSIYFVIQPDERLFVAVGGDVKTAIDAAPGSVRV